jgi:DNA polymerase
MIPYFVPLLFIDTVWGYAHCRECVKTNPAYLLRNLPDKAKAWEDLLFARRILRERAAPELPF